MDNIMTNTSTLEPSPSTLVRTVRTVTLLLISFVAIFGNILVVTAVLKYRKLRTPTNIFITNLAISNVLLGIMMIAIAGNVIHYSNILSHRGCAAWGFLLGVCGISSTYTMALVAVARFLIVARPTAARRAFIPLHHSLLLSLLPWFISVLILLGAVLGWTAIVFNPRTQLCSFSRQNSPAFQYFSIVLGMVSPLVCIVVFYSLLYWTVRKSRRRITSHSGTQVNKDPGTKHSDPKLTKMLLTILLVYVLCLMPYSFINILDSDGKRFPEYVHIIATWILFSNAAVNPVIYGMMNKNFREAYVALLGGKCDNRNNTSSGGVVVNIEEQVKF